MTFADWVRKTRERYRTEPPTKATVESANALRRGAQRRVDHNIGRSIWERGDWDVLVILDATRCDLWDDVANEYGLPTGEHVWSNASTSIDWIRRNIANRPEAKRAAYVTGNPFSNNDAPDAQSADLTDSDLAHFAPLYRSGWQDIGNGVWTIPPDVLTDHAIATWRLRDELGVERMVIHYMQPHQPFRGGISHESTWKNLQALALGEERGEHGAGVYDLLRRGEIDEAEVWTAYEDNLRWVLNDVTERLLTNLDAETVAISADHGNAMGEWGTWGHPPGELVPTARKVPWVTTDARDCRSVHPDTDLHEARATADTSEQLRALGYQ